MSRQRIALGAVAAFVVVLAAVGAFYLAGRARPTGEHGPAHGAAAAAEAPRAVRYHCPMHPTVVDDQPGDCPICHMSLVPIDESLGDDEPTSAAEPEGLAPVRLSPRKRQLIGMKTAEVAVVPFVRTVRAMGRVVADERRLATVSVKVSGWVERLHADATGQEVRKGASLLEVFSPDLLAAQQEYLIALRARSRTAGSELPSTIDAGDEIVASARRRLELLDVSDAEIRRLEAGGAPRRTVSVVAPASGVVLRRGVTLGDRVEAGSALFDLADLSRVWMIASVYEYELPFVKTGQTATMTLPYLPGVTREGRVTFVYPTLDPTTRTAQVRLEFANTDLALKPEMFAEVALHADLGPRLAVPESAVLDSGTRSVVFVDAGDGLLEPREIQVGMRLAESWEVLGGLAAGERVLTSGNFLVDSESKLKAALAAMAEHAH